ncbi:hypothetical protein [Shewanella marisflavi]|uniref:hypothetical protein n=1 Tax=Shewanella marisflavi TaxID=260364 RepID=UPI003AAE8C47
MASSFSRMKLQTSVVLIIFLFLFCTPVQALDIYRFNSSLDVHRQYTTQIIRELNENEIDIIEFDSNFNLLSHSVVHGTRPVSPCSKSILPEDVIRFGHAYKYWFSGQLKHCEIDPRTFPYSYDSVMSELPVQQSIIVLPIQNDIPADFESSEGKLIQDIFKLIPIADFSYFYPQIYQQLTKNGTLIVKEGKFTFHLLLLSKRDVK